MVQPHYWKTVVGDRVVASKMGAESVTARCQLSSSEQLCGIRTAYKTEAALRLQLNEVKPALISNCKL